MERLQNIGQAVRGEKSAQQVMDQLATEVDAVLGELSREPRMVRCAPKLNVPKPAEQWLANNRAPRRKLANEQPRGETIAYEQLLEAWREGRVR